VAPRDAHALGLGWAGAGHKLVGQPGWRSPRSPGPHAGVGGVSPEEGGGRGPEPLQGGCALLADPAEGFPAQTTRQPRA